MKKINSRYGDVRLIEDIGHGWFVMTGRSRFVRGGMNDSNTDLLYLDVEGGPFVEVGDDLGFGRIIKIETAQSAGPGTFKIRMEVER